MSDTIFTITDSRGVSYTFKRVHRKVHSAYKAQMFDTIESDLEVNSIDEDDNLINLGYEFIRKYSTDKDNPIQAFRVLLMKHFSRHLFATSKHYRKETFELLEREWLNLVSTTNGIISPPDITIPFTFKEINLNKVHLHHRYLFYNPVTCLFTVGHFTTSYGKIIAYMSGSNGSVEIDMTKYTHINPLIGEKL